ncbi:pro-resilin-like isoform X1 [Cherax quadricarinatus]|uniref:pro-resilin-like isoform X1 n=1 Tax=Cherax quadricarinatus TaxID=27406 RepID=UPI00387E4712
MKVPHLTQTYTKTVALVLLVVLVSWAAAQGDYGYQAPSVRGPDFASGPAQYNFQWDVNDAPSGNFFGHQEERDGDITRGSYYVRLPDSRLMRVDYYVDSTGYHPTITFEGEAQFPSGPASVYSQPAQAPRQVFPQPAPAPRQVFSQPIQAPRQVFSQPAPAPLQPVPAPSQLYSAPGK